MVSASRKSVVLGLLALVVVAILGGCATETKVWSYDEGAEIEQGLRQHETIVTQTGIYPSEDLSRYVAEVGGKLAAASERPDLRWHFTVLDSPRPRAFATRGGYVYVTRGMLALLRSESDLAAVLAHEISHIATRDAVRAEIRGNIIDVGSLSTGVAFPFETFLVGPYARASAGMRTAALNRTEEFEADRRGAENLRRTEYPAGSMSAVMEIFAGIEAHDVEHRRPSPDPYRTDRRYGIYADYLDYLIPAPAATEKVAGVEPFNRDYGRRSLDMRYRCFADDPSPHTRRFKLDLALQHSGVLERALVVLGNQVGSKAAPARATTDPVFLARLDGLEVGPGTPREDEARPKPIVLRIRKVREGDTFASLANTERVPSAETVLRLLNQRYPSGELEVGQLVKVIE